MTAQADIPPPQPPSANTSSSSTAESGSGAAAAAPPPQMPNGTLTFTLPFVFISNSTSSSSDDTSGNGNGNNHIPPEEIQHILSRFVRFIPLHFAAGGGQFEPIPSGPPKKHATQSALDHLKPVPIDTLPDQDRRCH